MTKSAAFTSWFAGSSITNDDGSPKVLYHGTTKDFKSFRHKPDEIGFHFGTIGQANDRLRHKAQDGGFVHELDHSGHNVIPVHLHIKSPLRMPDLGVWTHENVVDHLMRERLMTDDDVEQHNTLPKVRKFLQKKGYDGIVYKNDYEREGSAEMRREAEAAKHKLFDKKPSWHKDEPEMRAATARENEWKDYAKAGTEDSYIAFEPHQIKSTISATKFDPSSKAISESV